MTGRKQFPTSIFRRGEMDTEKTLSLWIEEDGDIQIGIGKMPHGAPYYLRELDEDPNRNHSVMEFTCCGCGGGHSPHTRKALLDLILAMEKDNKESPHRGGSRYD